MEISGKPETIGQSRRKDETETPVAPAKAGVQQRTKWIPASAGMTAFPLLPL
jgi:hypothetical protein